MYLDQLIREHPLKGQDNKFTYFHSMNPPFYIKASNILYHFKPEGGGVLENVRNETGTQQRETNCVPVCRPPTEGGMTPFLFSQFAE
jgi:hypothetical protein